MLDPTMPPPITTALYCVFILLTVYIFYANSGYTIVRINWQIVLKDHHILFISGNENNYSSQFVVVDAGRMCGLFLAFLYFLS